MENPEVSVITPTIRPDGLKLVESALKRQMFSDFWYKHLEDFEWLVGSPFEPDVDCIWVQDDFKGGLWTLNRIYNKLIKQAKADIIISIQDHTFFGMDVIDRFRTHFLYDPKSIVTGVGDKYDTVYPKKGTVIWRDPRRVDGGFRDTTFNNIEFNFCSIPKEALYAVGGFDEQMDFEFFGMDAYDTLRRISNVGGFKFVIDESIESFSEEHGRVSNWESKNGIHGSYDRYYADRNNNTLNYLL